MSGQYWDVVHTSSDGPGTAAIQRRYSFYIPASNISGVNSLAKFGFMIQATPSGAAVVQGTAGHAIKRYQILVDGKPVLDYVNPLATTNPDAGGPNDFDYYIQKAGGTVVQLPRDTSGELQYVQHLPLGIPLTQSEQRIEVVVDYDIWDSSADGYWNADVTTSAFKISILALYGMASETLSIGSGQSYAHSESATESVVIRGDASRGMMAGIMVFNDSQADGYGSDGIKAQLGGNYQLPLELWEVLNGDARGTGALHVPNIGDVTRVSGATAYSGLLGATFVNTFNLTPGANCTLMVSNGGAATTRFYYPVYVKALGTPAQAVPKMSVTVKPNPTATIADDSGQS